MQIDLGQNYRSGILELSHQESILRRLVLFQANRTGGRFHVGGFDIILKQNGNSMQRTDHPLSSQRFVPFCRQLKRPRIDPQNRVQFRSILIICFNSVQAGFHQLSTGNFSSLHRCMNFCDCLLRHDVAPFF